MENKLTLLADLLDNNEAAVAELSACKSKDAVIEVLARYDIIITADKFDSMIAQFEGDELSEDMLMSVVGGAGFLKKVGKFFKDLAQGFLDAM